MALLGTMDRSAEQVAKLELIQIDRHERENRIQSRLAQRRTVSRERSGTTGRSPTTTAPAAAHPAPNRSRRASSSGSKM